MEPFKPLYDRVAFRKQRIHRIESLGDAVFAIVMTLLVLDIRIPLQKTESEAGVWLGLVETLPEVFTFILSFSVAGQLWTVFTNQFNHIRESNNKESVIAIFCLLPVTLLPFSTSFLSEHLKSAVAIGFYIINILLILLMFTAHWLYSYYAGLVKVEDNRESEVHTAIMKRARIIILAYATVGVFSIFSWLIAFCGTIFLQIIITFNPWTESLSITRKKKRQHSKIVAPTSAEDGVGKSQKIV